MAWRDFYLTTPPKSVTYVLNLLCIRCPEPAPLSFSSFRISICLLFQRIIVSGNAIPYGIQSSQLYGFGRSINAATNIETAIQVKMETRIMKARSRGPEVFLIEK